MTFTEFIRTYTPDYFERERDFIANYTNRFGFFPQALKLWRESLFSEAIENYTNKILDFANERRRITIQ